MDYYYATWKYHGDEVMLEITFDLLLHQADGRPVISSEKSVEVIIYVKFYDATVHKYRAHTISHEFYSPPPTGVRTIQTDPPLESHLLHLEVKFKGFRTSIDVEKPSFTIGNGALQISMNFSVAAVITNNLVVHSGKGDSQGQKSTFISFEIIEEMEPYAQLIVYYFKNDTEWNADSLYFDVNDGTAIFKNKISLAFDKATSEPGDSIYLQVTTYPMSLANLVAVDQIVLLLKTGNDISQIDVCTLYGYLSNLA
ncbi:hypothetical protein CHS0354_038626 [Potamilus streckersoni]|uniref:Alpha-2-macroglobulin bait region domain-containing protein n=1 Tax=Potamilus streckersoni TaxID=2493646 RepID=A0AAE0TH79_9BIVA|nr:hypothetical protein CHS0354_038626 [Potamilus streckersoni]